MVPRVPWSFWSVPFLGVNVGTVIHIVWILNNHSNESNDAHEGNHDHRPLSCSFCESLSVTKEIGEHRLESGIPCGCGALFSELVPFLGGHFGGSSILRHGHLYKLDEFLRRAIRGGGRAPFPHFLSGLANHKAKLFAFSAKFVHPKSDFLSGNFKSECLRGDSFF